MGRVSECKRTVNLKKKLLIQFKVSMSEGKKNQVKFEFESNISNNTKTAIKYQVLNSGVKLSANSI